MLLNCVKPRMTRTGTFISVLANLALHASGVESPSWIGTSPSVFSTLSIITCRTRFHARFEILWPCPCRFHPSTALTAGVEMESCYPKCRFFKT